MAKDASFAVYKLSTEIIRNDLVPKLKEINNFVASLSNPKTPAFSDAREWSNLAVGLIEAVKEGKCRCSLYTLEKAFRFMPENEEKHGLVKITSKREIPWEDEFDCECTECGQKFQVKENHGYHYPMAKWTLHTKGYTLNW